MMRNSENLQKFSSMQVAKAAEGRLSGSSCVLNHESYTRSNDFTPISINLHPFENKNISLRFESQYNEGIKMQRAPSNRPLPLCLLLITTL